jgi:hypothetical protein
MTGTDIELYDLRTLTALTYQGRALVDGRSVGNICGRVLRHRESDPPLLDYARAAGWRVGHRADGTPDAICPRCARPDPITAAICRDLAKETSTR